MRTAHGEKRDPLDRCYTPPNLADAIVVRLMERELITPGDDVIDSGVGAAAFYDRLVFHGMTAWGLDIDAEAPALLRPACPTLWHGDFLKLSTRASAVVGNPPFSLAEAFVKHGLLLAPVVAFLLPNLFLGAGSRYESGFWDKLAVNDPLVERAGFDGPGVRPDRRGKGGMAQHSLLVWKLDHRGDCVGRHLPWGGMRKSKKPLAVSV